MVGVRVETLLPGRIATRVPAVLRDMNVYVPVQFRRTACVTAVRAVRGIFVVGTPGAVTGGSTST